MKISRKSLEYFLERIQIEQQEYYELEDIHIKLVNNCNRLAKEIKNNVSAMRGLFWDNKEPGTVHGSKLKNIPSEHLRSVLTFQADCVINNVVKLLECLPWQDETRVRR